MEPMLSNYLNFKVHENPNRINDYLRTYVGESLNANYGASSYYPVLGGIETDNSKLKSMTINISNWDREYYIPYILNMYYFQDYPKELIEIIIVDENSQNKNQILEMIKEQVKLYPEIKFKYIQLNKNVYQNGCKRNNTGARFASNEITISNPSDSIPLGTNFLRGHCYSHNLRDTLYVLGLPYQTIYGQSCTPFNFSNLINDVFNAKIEPHWRLGHGLLISLSTKIWKEMHGMSENNANGGFEGNHFTRVCMNGGLMHMNTEIAGIDLPNFPFSCASTDFINKTSALKIGDWANKYCTDDPDWGITDKMEIYEFNG